MSMSLVPPVEETLPPLLVGSGPSGYILLEDGTDLLTEAVGNVLLENASAAAASRLPRWCPMRPRGRGRRGRGR